MGSGGRSPATRGRVAPTAPAPRPAQAPVGVSSFAGGNDQRAPAGGLPASVSEELLAVASAERAAADAAAGRARENWAESEPEDSYLDDPAAFQQAYRADSDDTLNRLNIRV
jgi:hypothetical protein